MSLPRYPKYKESGVEWLGEVPAHWEVKRFQRCVDVAEGQVDPEDAVYAAMSLIAPNHVESGTGRLLGLESASEQGAESGKYLCTKGDVVYSKIRPALRKACIAPEDCLCSADMYPLRAHSGLGNPFLLVFMLSEQFSSLAVLESQRVAMPKINRESLKEISLVVPPIAEQAVITAFLDRETAKIDALVAEQQRLIELLKEKRQAVISHAVTKGLNPDVPMKDSGIEWLGEVPAHWVVARLGYYSTIENGTTPSREEPAFWDDGTVPWIASGEVNQARITEASELITQKALQECSLRLLPAGAVVIGMIGQGKTRGLSAILEINATINQNLAAILTDRRLGSRFLQHVLATGYDYLREFGRGGQQAALNCEILKSLRVPVPPIEEQEDICEHLSRVLPSFDTLTAEAQRAIELLQERRTALISAAVTGQIDVRSSGKRASA